MVQDPHLFNLTCRIVTSVVAPHPDPNLDPDTDPHQFADVKPKCMEYEPILSLFQEFEPFF